MKTKIKLVASLVIMCLMSINPILAQKNKDIEEKVRAMNQQMAKQMLEGNISTDHYANDAISLPNNAPMVEGLEAIKASNEQMLQMGIKFDKVEFVTTKVMVNGDMVTEIGTYNMTMSFANVPQPITDKGKYITIWEIQKGGDLKIKVETWNTDMPPAGMN